jgi:enoyl-CoA hydratase
VPPHRPRGDAGGRHDDELRFGTERAGERRRDGVALFGEPCQEVGDVIERERADGVEIVRLAHGKVNALDLELVTTITETFTALGEGSPEAVVFTGSGNSFCDGVDLWRFVDGGPGYGQRFLAALVDAFEAVFNIGKPVVAAVNGHAIAGGCILVSGCDYRIMGDTGRIGVTELAVGVPFPLSALEILRFAVGDRSARQAVFAPRPSTRMRHWSVGLSMS